MDSHDPRPAFDRLDLRTYLEQDSRPTVVIDLGLRTADTRPTIVYSNPASKLSRVDARIKKVFSDVDHGQFYSWLTSTAKGPLRHENFIWSAVTVDQRWRIVSAESDVGDRRFDADREEAKSVAHEHSLNPSRTNTTAVAELLSALDLDDIFQFLDPKLSSHCQLVQNTDWAATPLGSMRDWSMTTLQVVLHVLSNPEPCCTFWGSERVMLYNEPYIALIRDLHPAAMGTSAKTHFAQFWPVLESMFAEIQQTRTPVKQDAYRIMVERGRGLEELYFNSCYIPILDPAGDCCGVLNHVSEITNQIMAQRQMETLLKVSENTASIMTLSDLWQAMFASMRECTAQIPFALLYSSGLDRLGSENVDGHSSSDSSSVNIWHLEGSTGLLKDHAALVSSLNIHGNIGFAPAIKAVHDKSQPTKFHKNEFNFPQDLCRDSTHVSPETAVTEFVACPILLSTGKIMACLLVGINPQQPYDEEYERFMNLLSRQIGDVATAVFLLERERRRVEATMAQAEQQRIWLSEQLRLQAREAREHELRFYTFAKQAPVGIYVIGADGDIKFANDAFRDFLNLPEDDKSSEPWLPNIHPDDVALADAEWESLRKGNVQTNFEYRTVRPKKTSNDGQDVTYLRSWGFPELAEDGTMKTVTGVVMDVTVHKAHERAAVDQLAAALEAKRVQENFMDMVSHEMRNPLNAMLQCAEEISQMLADLSKSRNFHPSKVDVVKTALDAVDTIQWCGLHQRQIIDDVLTISKLDSNLLTLCPAETTPISVIEQAVKIFASDVRASDIQLSQDVSHPDNHSLCWLDPSRVLQILINLVGNAIKFVKDRPVRELNLTVETSNEKPVPKNIRYIPSGRQRLPSLIANTPEGGRPIYVSFSITDTGPGLTPEEADSLFARFKQASPRTHAQYGGSGLGLFISRELTEMHGGEIGLQSEPGKGSTFGFYIKAFVIEQHTKSSMSESASVEKQGPTPDVTGVTSGQVPAFSFSPSDTKVLIVEDNLINQKVLNRQLKRLDFKTATANHGLEALTIIEHSRWWHENKIDADDISIVLCDLEMPVMNGMACIRAIRQWEYDSHLKAHLPVVAVTGNARPEQVNAARKAGFDDIICKPYSVPDLVQLIKQVLEKESLRS